MKTTIEIQLRRVEGAMIRTVGLIERRGFSVASISLIPGREAGEMLMHVDVETNHRSFSVLARQLDKLIDVSAVSLSNQEEPCERLEVRKTC